MLNVKVGKTKTDFNDFIILSRPNQIENFYVAGKLQGAENIVFIHTGGLFGVFPQHKNFQFV